MSPSDRLIMAFLKLSAMLKVDRGRQRGEDKDKNDDECRIFTTPTFGVGTAKVRRAYTVASTSSSERSGSGLAAHVRGRAVPRQARPEAVQPLLTRHLSVPSAMHPHPRYRLLVAVSFGRLVQKLNHTHHIHVSYLVRTNT